MLRVPRKRPKPGERRIQILQTLAHMLEQPGAERVTTAGLASKLDVSEAALYRHFASKAQMFDGLLDFIEQSVLERITDALKTADPGRGQARAMVTAVLRFAQDNPGMARVMVGDALVFENERLVTRMGQFFDQIEGQLRAILGGTSHDVIHPLASVLVSFIAGRLQRFARSGFKRSPTEELDAALKILLV
jgi:TetR/AcrR family transcriptional regulator